MNNLEGIGWHMKAQIEHWRCMRKSGDVLTMTETSMQQFGHMHGLRQVYQPPTFEEIAALAHDMGCEWAFNPAKRLYYFIPKELMGEQK